MKPQPRAAYSYTVHASVIAIVDHDEGRSVTNDAANVIQNLAAQGFDLAQYRVIYRDTRGIWDELKTENGRFAGYASINETDLEAALAKLDRAAPRRPPGAPDPRP
jgi:predicted alpha/beta hydrolase